MTKSIEVIKGITKYRKFQLGPIDLQIPKGMITAVIGRNGAGKTTLLKGISGLPPFQSGEVTFNGKIINFLDPSIRNHMTYISNDIQMYSDFSVKQALHMVSSLHDTWADEWVYHWLTVFKIEKDMGIHELSKGMKMKLNLLLGLGHQPEVVLLDEPTDGLDSISRQQFFDLLQTYVDENTSSVVISTHYTKDVEGICDYVIFMKDGKAPLTGEVEDLKETYKFFSMPPNDGYLEKSIGVMKSAVEMKGIIHSEDETTLPTHAVVKKPSLDDIFLYVIENGGVES